MTYLYLFFFRFRCFSSANCALHLSPSLLLGSKLRELLTCLNHKNPVCRKRPIMSLRLSYSLGFVVFVPFQKSMMIRNAAASQRHFNSTPPGGTSCREDDLFHKTGDFVQGKKGPDHRDHRRSTANPYNLDPN